MIKKLEFRRWFIAGAAIVIQLCLGTIHSWSVFKKPLMAGHGWSELSTQLVYVILMVFMGLSCSFVGALVKKRGPKITAVLGGALFGSGILLAGFAAHIGNPWLLYFGYGVIGGIGAGFAYVTPISILLRWFPDKRGLISGLAVMGFGVGSFFMGLLAPKMIINIGVGNTLYIFGTIFFAAISSAALLCKNPPKGWLPAGFIPATCKASLTNSFAFNEAIKKHQFWLLWGILFLSISVGFGVISQLSPVAQEIIKKNNPMILPDELAMAGGKIMAITMIFNGFGRIIWAWVSDNIGRKKTLAIMFISQSILYFYLPQVTNVILFTAIICYLLSCFGAGFSIMPAFTADAFGPDNVEKIYGMILTSLSFGGIVGPVVFAQMKSVCLYIAACLLMIGFMLILLFKNPEKLKCDPFEGEPIIVP